MNSLPVRLFHACLSGILAGLLLTLLFFHIQGRFLRPPSLPHRIVDIGPSPLPAPSPSPAPVASDPPANPDDRDGDGIPNDWEIQFHHNPDNATDAASDFDNDGLTALQEFDLYQQSSGASGNPLGMWRVDELSYPVELGYPWVGPVDINNRGQVLIAATLMTDFGEHYTAYLIDAGNNWIEIDSHGENSPIHLDPFDLNDNGEVVGAYHSFDWSEHESFIWDQSAGLRTFTFNGEKAEANRINNYGDWIGSVEDPVSGAWKRAFVMDGVNLHPAGDWWPYASYTDLNDYGEAMGRFFNPLTGRYHAFLAHGGWIFDTGLLGGLPFFDPNTNYFSEGSAMNNYGEFAGGAAGYQQNEWGYTGFLFDGEFNRIQFAGRELVTLSPSAINSSKAIIGYATAQDGHSGYFLYCDGIGLFLDELLPGFENCYAARINDAGQFVSVSADESTPILVSPDQDQDGDSMPDDWEDFYGLDKNSASDATDDADGDATNNLGEFLLRSDPNSPAVIDPNGQTIDLRPGIDTDGDGIPNTWEWQNGLAYDDATDAPLDFDRDGYTNLQEFRLNTDPRGAPSYRMQILGPFPGASSASLNSAVLGDGQLAGSATYLGGNITETVHLPVYPDTTSPVGQRPSTWSLQRATNSSGFSIASGLTNTTCYQVAHSPSGASLYYRSANPRQFFYWPSTTTQPITLFGEANQNDISYLGNARISPSGTFVVGHRNTVSTGSYQPVVWKMPTSAANTFKPIHLVPPAGASLPSWVTLYVNDHGYVLANGTFSGQNRPILWKVSPDGLTATASILPALPGSTWASATGISNQDPPLICGNSSATNQNRAVVWTAAGTVTNLGTLSGGNSSYASLISRGGSIAGVSNVLVGNTLRQQPFLVTYNAATSSWKLQAQGEPSPHSPSLTSVNDFGEILGTVHEYTPSYRAVRTVWRHGRAHRIEDSLNQAAGATIENVTQISPHGTLLATVHKDGSNLTVLLIPDRDTDNDGLPDAYENQHGFNAFVKNNPTADSDSDGLSDLDELRNNTNPLNPDTDADGMKDGWEVSWGLLPLDPSDAPLDPDNDRVTNLRESQIGTTPTGIYKVETRLTDTTWSYPYVMAASDDGQIVYSGEYYWNGGTDENGVTWEEYSQNYYALPPVGTDPAALPISLPPSHGYQTYNSDWSETSYSNESTTYRIDSSNGFVNADIVRYSYDSSSGSYEESGYLIPDIVDHPDETSWIPWPDIESNLRNPDLHGGTAPLNEYDILNPYAEIVSPAGLRRIHRSSYGECFILDESGGFIGKTPDTGTWTTINDHGIAARVESAYYDSDWNWVEDSPRIQLSTGQIITLPTEPDTTSNYTLVCFSNDRKALLSKQVKNEQLAYITQFHLLDTATGNLTRLRQPGFGSESIHLLSNQNARLLGNGPKPFQITPDGTCIRIDALRIKNSLADTPVPFGSLYPGALTPNHIASNGRITLTTTNALSQTVILQLTPHNDTDGDGMPDDWEASFDISDPDGDADSDGFSNLEEFTTGTDVSNQDTDGDGIPDGIDGQPLVNYQQFADADADGIPDSNDAEPNTSRGSAPSIASENAAGNPLCNLIKDETVKFVIAVSNPAGPAPTASNLTFFLNGVEATANITAIGSPSGSSRRFSLSWTANITPNYPSLTLQNLSLRFRDSENATRWLNLARIDVAEWEGMIASLRTGAGGQLPLMNVICHFNGVKSRSLYHMSTHYTGAGWYRGPLSLSFIDGLNGAPLITAQIGQDMRYPLFLISGSSQGPPTLVETISISSPTQFSHHGVLTLNNSETNFRSLFAIGGETMASSGERAYLALPEPVENGTANTAVRTEYVRDGHWKLLTAGTLPLYDMQSNSRVIWSTRVFPSSGLVPVDYDSMDLRPPVERKITPHAAGTLEFPGLPLPININYGSEATELFPIRQGTWHKIVLKVGPDAAALSDGIGLWLRKGEDGDSVPQSGFNLKVQINSETLEDLVVPADGKIRLIANSPNWLRLTSPGGLVLFVQRDENVKDFHRLSLQLLKKQSWYPKEAVDIASVGVLPLDVVPDWNRDEVIDASDRGNARSDNPWRTWINDDADQGNICGDVTDVPGIHGAFYVDTPEEGLTLIPDKRNSSDRVVNDRSDTIDFSPLLLDIKGALNLFPEDEVTVRLKHSENSLNFVYTDLTPGNVGNYLRKEGPLNEFSPLDCYGPSFKQKVWNSQTTEITSDGVELTKDFVRKIRSGDKGVILVEGTSETRSPLIVEFEHAEKIVCSFGFPISLSSVNSMYRWLNLRPVITGEDSTDPTNINEPSNYPDELCNEKTLVFIHGYSVTEKQARGWCAEVFKRFHQSGSRARFVGVTFRGDESRVEILAKTPDYHQNVVNAFLSSPTLKVYLNNLPGEKHVIAHSLGNIVAASAIKDWGAAVASYYAVNAAVAMEAFDGSLESNYAMRSLMRDLRWALYVDLDAASSNPRRLWSSEWYKLYSDSRRTLTWRDRFGNLPAMWNFFSSGEDTLENPVDDQFPPNGELWSGRWAWVAQEKAKGTSTGWMTTADRSGGWGFNPSRSDALGLQSPDIAGALALTSEQIRLSPLFWPIDEEGIHSPDGDGFHVDPARRARVLGMAIPALSFATGANALTPLDATGRNIDMMTLKQADDIWPERPRPIDKGKWRHCDFRDVAFYFTQNFYAEIRNKGNLNQ